MYPNINVPYYKCSLIKMYPILLRDLTAVLVAFQLLTKSHEEGDPV